MREDCCIVLGVGLLAPLPDPVASPGGLGAEPADVVGEHVQAGAAVVDPLGKLLAAAAAYL